jgi:branched-subunit amino acid aminotransferase/4-amino-4-deoxychorismate lyase
MHDKVFFDGKIRSLSKAKISALSSAALYGRGIFTTIAIYNSKPFLWHLHEKRLQRNTEKVGLNPTKADLQKSLLEVITVNKVKTGRARITLFEAGASTIWRFGEEKRTVVLITTAEKNEQENKELKLTISPFRINSQSPLAGVKSCNYLEKLIALENVRGQGFAEALSANERGEIASAVMANVFWVKDQQIYTPALATGALAGTTREFVIELAREKGFIVNEVTARIAEINAINEIFLTSAGLGVCAVNQFEKKKLVQDVTSELDLYFRSEYQL